jgi:hypothetical protein
MTQYKAPLRDMRFLMNEVLDYPAHYASLPNGKDADPEMVDAILDGAAQLCEDVLAPLNHSGDIEGCHFETARSPRPRASRRPTNSSSRAAGKGCLSPPSTVARACPCR